MNILLNGITGAMGRAVTELAAEGNRNITVAAGVDINPAPEGTAIRCYKSLDNAGASYDCLLDFSHHSCTEALVSYATKNNMPLVIATTGQTEDELKMIYAAAKSIPIFFSYNYSLGIALLTELAKKTAEFMPDAEIEIIEKHHNRKLDAPSGTAIQIANAIKEVRPGATVNSGRSGYGKRTPEEIGIHSLRMGNLVGEHEVIICTENQSITLKHEAYSRSLFAEGALAAVQYIVNKPAGLYDMKSMVST